MITKPVLEISRISEKMSDLQLNWTVDEQRTDELGTLGKSLNRLSYNLSVTLSDLQNANKRLEADIEHEKKLEQARTNFFSAVSHELKTPITIMKGLYIVQEILHLHGSECTVCNTQAGVKFSFTI